MPNEQPTETRLDSWKEIAEYLQRNTTTARRWEREEGLPVHRLNHKSRSSVYAYPTEIDSWRASRKVVPEAAPPRPLWKIPAFALTILLCLVMVGNGIRPVSAQQSGKAIAKRLCTACPTDVYAPTLTLDGRWMANVDTGDVAVRDMSTGKETRLTKRVDDESADWAMLSPDLRQVAYLWEPKDNPGRVQLRVIANQPGSEPRVVVDSPEFEYFDPVEWSRDGKSMLVVANKPDRTWQLVWVSLADGSIKMLKSLDWRLRGVGGAPSPSPDGRYLAYAALATNPKSAKGPPEFKDEHIYILALDGSGETELVKTSGANRAPTWTPDGKHILFVSDRSGTFDLWSVAVQSGKAAGAPSRVMTDIGKVFPMGITRSGSYYYRQSQSDVEYVGIAEGNRITESFVGIRPEWSPDGKSIAFKRHHPGNAQAYDLVVRSLETGDEKTYTTKLGFATAGEPRWLHDGSISDWISGVPYRVDLKSGEFKPLSEASSSLSMEDRTTYVGSPDDKDAAHVPDRIMALDLVTRKETQILTMPEPGQTRPVPSPDGRMLAIVRNDPPGVDHDRKFHVARLAVDGSVYREIYTAFRDEVGGNLAWTKDSRGIVFDQPREDGWRVMRIPAEGGTPEFTGLEIKGKGKLQNIGFSPDGSRLVFSSVKSGPQVWVLDNVLSALK